MKIKDIEINNGMKNLHDTFGIDWQKPYIELEHKGKFTVNSMKKELASHGYTTEDSLVLVFINTPHDYLPWGLVQITHDGFKINLPTRFYAYWKKSQFNERRNEDSTIAIFFAQKKEYLKGAKYDYRHDRYYVNNPAPSMEYTRFKDERELPPCYYDVYALDKSGYCAIYYRDKLESRLKAYKADKRKAEYLKTDNTDKVHTLERLIKEFKEKLSKAILSIETSEECYKISDYLDGYNQGLYSIMEDFEYFKKNTLNKSFESIEKSNACYDSCARRLYAYLNV